MTSTDELRVYCSGPLFSPEELAAMTEIARELEARGWRTFLPHRDGIEAYVMPFANTPLDTSALGARDAIDRAIFALDVYQLARRCDVLVFNANGRVPDEGGVVEASIAFAVGTPVVIYKHDARSAFNGRDNAMLTGLTGGALVRELSSLVESIEKAVSKRATGGAEELPEPLAGTVSLGRKIWSVLERLNRLRGAGSSNDELVDRLVALMAAD